MSRSMSTAAFIFEKLEQMVKSASYFCWLKSLAQFSTSEKQMQSLFLLDQSTLICLSEINFAERQGLGRKFQHNYMDILLGTHNILLSSEELLETSDMGHILSFQTWFLTIRAKFLGTVVDMMNLLDTISFIRDDPPPSEQLERCILFPCDSTSCTLGSLIYALTEVSYWMKKLAQELDLLILSSIGMGRLRQKDAHTRRDLLYLLKSLRKYYKGHSFLRFQSQISVAGYESRVLHKLCEDSIIGIVSLQKEASLLQNCLRSLSGLRTLFSS